MRNLWLDDHDAACRLWLGLCRIQVLTDTHIESPGQHCEMLDSRMPVLKELQGKITDVLNKIPEEFRLPIILVIMGDFSYEEAAEMLSCPVGTIRSRLFRGRKLVYKELKGYMGLKEKSKGQK